jgi:hypothetical protein
VCRVKLSLLHRPSSSSSSSSSSYLQPISFKDFTTSKASSKAKKASAKGFGGAAAKQQAGTPAAAAAAVEVTDDQLEAVLACNAYGDDHTDGALTYCRNEHQRSVIGEWLECACMLPSSRSFQHHSTPAHLSVNLFCVGAVTAVPVG